VLGHVTGSASMGNDEWFALVQSPPSTRHRLGVEETASGGSDEQSGGYIDTSHLWVLVLSYGVAFTCQRLRIR
jgi:hypothetical protein